MQKKMKKNRLLTGKKTVKNVRFDPLKNGSFYPVKTSGKYR